METIQIQRRIEEGNKLFEIQQLTNKNNKTEQEANIFFLNNQTK